jgi:hypothetical protein
MRKGQTGSNGVFLQVQDAHSQHTLFFEVENNVLNIGAVFLSQDIAAMGIDSMYTEEKCFRDVFAFHAPGNQA